MRVIVFAAAVLGVVLSTGGAVGADTPEPLPFYPQAGVIGKDLYVANHVDLDPGPGIRDYSCGSQTYDTHTGQDSIIRSFREMDIGVPVFAVLDGEVISTQDGFYDREFGPTRSQFDNHIVIQHGPGRFTIYGHLRRGLTLSRGDKVVAGQQIGWTASSGNSSWPHLHFTYKEADEVVEPFAGPCRPGPSRWLGQPVPERIVPYARDLAVSAKPFRGAARLPYDKAVRTGTFVRGARTVYLRLELGAVSAGQPLRIRLLRPDGSIAVADDRTIPFAIWHGYGHGYFAYRVAFTTEGDWPLTVNVDDWTVVDTTLHVVTTKRQARNRRPNTLGATLLPEEPTVNDVLQCRAEASLVNEDPDFDIVRYRYRWSVAGRPLRTVTTAALSDVLRRGLVSPWQGIECDITPSDGRLSGPTARTAGTIRP